MLAVKMEGDKNQVVKGLLKGLLEKGMVDAVLTTLEIPAGESFVHVLTESPQVVEKSWPMPPVMPVQGGRVISRLTKKGPLEFPAAVVLRPCELRAMTELSKLNQVNRENILTVSFDCPGAYPLAGYIEGDKESLRTDFLDGLEHFTLSGIRPLCQVCHHCIGRSADIEVGFIGAPEGSSYLIAHTDRGEEALRALGYQGGEDLQNREAAVREFLSKRLQDRMDYFSEEFGSQVTGTDALLSTLHNCINCHNCMRVCPICFCRECFFDSDALKVDPGNYLMRAHKKGSLRFMPDTLLSHLGRMNHMSVSCVSCGSCEDACPNSVPVSRLFAMVGDKTQAIFDYVPGRDLGEPIPFMDYKEEELQEWEKPYIEERAVQPPTVS